MSTPTKKHGRLYRPDAFRCPADAHNYPAPVLGRRPVVVFCTRCQTGKDLK